MSDTRSRDLNRKNAQTASSQDIVNSNYWNQIVKGPSKESMERRRKTQFCLRSFMEIYQPDVFCKEWSSAHLRAIKLLEDSVLRNRRFALSLPRGSGKSSMCGTTVIWAMLHGHSRYSVSIGATARSAKQRIQNIKSTLKFNPLLFGDFPESIAPIRFTNGESRRATGQKANGQSTDILWAQDQIRLASLHVDLPWLEKEGFNYPYGCMVDTSSIDGEIRGKAVELPDGTIQRPTFVVADDIQTRESAKNPDTVRHRESILKGDVAYLGGPGQPIGLAVPITVLYENDLADRLLNHDLNPEFRGERTSGMASMPGEGCNDEERDSIDKLWEEYDILRRADHLSGSNNATGFYKENHSLMTKGAEATWLVRFNEDKGEVDAIQHAMNLRLEDERAFWAEFMNKPLDTDTSDQPPLKPLDVSKRLTAVLRGQAPDDADFCTAFIDISRNVLWWTVVSYKSQDFTGTVIDYGAWPQQNAAHFTLSTVRKKIPDVYSSHGEYVACLHAAINDCVDYIASRTWYTEAEQEIPLKNIGIDSGWGQHSVDVYRNCKRSHYKHLVVPTKGFGITPLKKPLVDPEKKQQAKTSITGQWRFSPTLLRNWLLTYDTNLWKSKVNQSLRVPIGNRGAMTFYGASTSTRKPDHRMISEQVCSETSAWLESGTRKVETWSVKVDKSDNHFLDCLVGCHVLAHVNGAKMPEPSNKAIKESNSNNRKRKRRKISF